MVFVGWSVNCGGAGPAVTWRVRIPSNVRSGRLSCEATMTISVVPTAVGFPRARLVVVESRGSDLENLADWLDANGHKVAAQAVRGYVLEWKPVDQPS